jgi:hypothetical protein
MDKEVCAQAPSGFDAIFAAAGHSQLAGVLAAVVFTAIILLLSDRTSPPPIPWSRQNALIVMVPTFVGLLVVSFCFAVTMGETECSVALSPSLHILSALLYFSAVSSLPPWTIGNITRPRGMP